MNSLIIPLSGISFGIVILFSVLLICISIFQIILFIRSLKEEKNGCIKLTEAAQELGNRTLHESGKHFFISNQSKYWILYLSLASIVLSVLMGLLIAADH